jgi:hypothetical protein
VSAAQKAPGPSTVPGKKDLKGQKICPVEESNFGKNIFITGALPLCQTRYKSPGIERTHKWLK